LSLYTLCILLAHQLYLALIIIAKEVFDVHTFFHNFIFIVNIISVSCKYNDELQASQVVTIEYLIAIDEIETSKWTNQRCASQQPRDSR